MKTMRITSFIKIIVLFSLMNSPSISNGQWDTIAEFNQVIYDMKTYHNKLFLGGNFTQYNGQVSYWSCFYDAAGITPHLEIIGGGGIRQMAVFEDELYAAGDMQHSFAIGVSKWDGNTWIDGGSTNYSHSIICADQTGLYVVGDNGIVRRKNPGGVFSTFYDFQGNGSVSAIKRFGDLLVFAGNFNEIDGTPAKNIGAWNGTTWVPLGAGLEGAIYCMEVYQNELYVAGKVTEAGGNPVNYIAKWDGSYWTGVGGGINGLSLNGIRDMREYNGELYVVGDFDEMGTVSSHDIVKWNGSQWIEVGLTHSDAFLNTIEVYQHTLHVGSFDFDHSHLFQYTALGGLDVTEKNENLNWKIFPNPATSHIQIELPEDLSYPIEIRFSSITGQLKKQQIIQSPMDLNWEVSGYKPGMYFVTILSVGNPTPLSTLPIKLQ